MYQWKRETLSQLNTLLDIRSHLQHPFESHTTLNLTALLDFIILIKKNKEYKDFF